MRLGRFHRFRAEGKSERRSFVPCLPLIHVVRAQEISALPGHDVQSRLIQVRQIRGEALRRPVMPRHRLHRISAARLLLHSGPDQCRITGIFPRIGCWISTALNAPQRHDAKSFGASGPFTAASTAAVSSSSIVRIFFRQPALGAVQQNVLQPHRTHLPRVGLPIQDFLFLMAIGRSASQLRLQEAGVSVRESNSPRSSAPPTRPACVHPSFASDPLPASLVPKAWRRDPPRTQSARRRTSQLPSESSVCSASMSAAENCRPDSST